MAIASLAKGKLHLFHTEIKIYFQPESYSTIEISFGSQILPLILRYSVLIIHSFKFFGASTLARFRACFELNKIVPRMESLNFFFAKEVSNFNAILVINKICKRQKYFCNAGVANDIHTPLL